MEFDIRDLILGTWKLVSTEETMNDGTTQPFAAFGPRAQGFLMYQRNGYMCAVLVNPDRQQLANPAQATVDEKLAAADGTFFYCGRYEIDLIRKQIVHLPEVASNPSYVGSRQIRPYEFEDDRLIFSDVEKDDPSISSWKIVWEKVRQDV
jgi:Lipocalin-like domain